MSVDVSFPGGAELGAFFVAFVLVALGVPLLLPLLRRWKFGQHVRDVGPERHQQKQGTPTMGGLVFLLAVPLATLFFVPLHSSVLLLIFAYLALGFLGFADDATKIILRRPLGLRARTKLFVQLVVASVLAVGATASAGGDTAVALPFLPYQLELGYLYYLLVVLVMLASTNAVNLADGLDGLAAGASIPVLLAFAWIAWQQAQHDLALFALTLIGALIGFLLYNWHPARVFMGDTGSLAIGGALGGLALLTRSEFAFLIMGGLFVIEALSVILQVLFYRYRGKRLFRMSPIHHHFELVGWSEKRVVLTFWMISAGSAWLGLWGWSMWR